MKDREKNKIQNRVKVSFSCFFVPSYPIPLQPVFPPATIPPLPSGDVPSSCDRPSSSLRRRSLLLRPFLVFSYFLSSRFFPFDLNPKSRGSRLLSSSRKDTDFPPAIFPLLPSCNLLIPLLLSSFSLLLSSFSLLLISLLISSSQQFHPHLVSPPSDDKLWLHQRRLELKQGPGPRIKGIKFSDL
ncbi:hypothetical protein H6P81_020194 [Aristolochia fimbriata]|uniref:Uncharacterized protein n=1 Tax=Aristolochia fimbriata TaxID=158543 RepID=A0AAV7DU31_ARIFI|nr:hypothetical protein H6P81_020194 [Aristolochia fimbriata]